MKELKLNTNDFQELLTELKAISAEYMGQKFTEQDTKNVFIEPILTQMGWSKRNPSRVRAEFRFTGQDNPVDYALKSGEKWMMFVEAKALSKSIKDHKYITQAVNYASNAGVAWALLTNGRQWDLYSTFERKPAKERLSFSVSIDDDDFLDRMQLLTFESIEHLDAHLRSQQNRSTVKAAVEQLFQTQDKGLLRLLKSKTDLEAGAIRTALADLQVRFGEEGAVCKEPEPVVTEPATVESAPLKPMSLSLYSIVFSCVNQSGVSAKGRLSSDGFIVLAGSVGSAKIGKSLASYLVEERADLIRKGQIINEGHCVRFMTDVVFKGPSRASNIVLGRGGTGLVHWKDYNGKTLAELKTVHSRPQSITDISRAATDNQLLSVFGLNAPGANKRPIFIRIEGKEYPAKNWRELYVHACEHVAMRYPKEWDEVLLSEVFMGRKSRAFGLNGGGMRSPKKISRGFIEVHFSGDDMIKSLQKLFKFVGIDPAQVEYAMLSKS